MPGVMSRVLASGVRAEASLTPLIVRILSSSTTQQNPTTATTTVQQPPLKSLDEIPGPRNWPLVGVIPYFFGLYRRKREEINMKNPHELFGELSKEFGPVTKMTIPLNPKFVIITRPEDCETLVRATMENPIRDGFTALGEVRRKATDDYFEGKTGIINENGEEWYRVRSRVQTPMMKPKNINAYIPAMDQVALDFMDRIATLQEQHGEMPSDFQTELYKWALESVGLVALNRRMGCLAPDLAPDSEPMRFLQLVNDIVIYLNKTEMASLKLWKIFPTKDFKILQEKHQEFVKLADDNIKQTEATLRTLDQNTERDLTLMETLLLVPGLSYKDVVTLILDMLSAGIDTTSNSLGFTLYLLARNPEVQQRLQAEVDSVVGDLEGPLSANHLAQLSYLKAVVKESMRIFPVTVGVARTIDKDLALGGYLVPKGWMVFANTLLSGWDEDQFPRAKEFLPERWLRHRPLGPIHPYASLPFGVGTRMCVGRRIAEQEIYIFLTRVMQRYTVDYQYEDMGIVTRMLLAPSLPLKFNFKPRK